MKQIQNVTLTVHDANALLGVDMEPTFYDALVRMVAYPELIWDAASQTIRHPGYVPFEALAKEWIEGVEEGIYDVHRCEVCAGYFDANDADGIFGNLPEREEFLCARCARVMTAREYFDRFVARGDVY